MKKCGRSAPKAAAPRAIVLENVVGVLTSHDKRDFRALVATLDGLGYRVGALTLDARWFTPQSRPRVFFVALQKSLFAALAREGCGLISRQPQPLWTPSSLRAAHDALPIELAENWIWWRLPEPSRRNADLVDLLEDAPADAPWRAPAAIERLLALMAPAHRRKIEEMQVSGARAVGAVYRRTRIDESGAKRQRAEVRFDGLAGCLRTPRGGSSRQTILEVYKGKHSRPAAVAARGGAADGAARFLCSASKAWRGLRIMRRRTMRAGRPPSRRTSPATALACGRAGPATRRRKNPSQPQ